MSEIITPPMLDEVIRDSAKLEGCVTADECAKHEKKYRELLEIVDDDGNVLGSAPRGLAHRIGLRHTVVYCVVRNSSGDKWLLQTRGSGRLDISVGGHVQADESSYSDALAREFSEELGLTPEVGKFQSVAVYHRDAELRPDRPLVRNRERRHVFAYNMTEDEEKSLLAQFKEREEQEAVLGFSWFTVKEVEEAVQAGKCADGLASSMPHLLENC
ncbi:MAG TPA: NUDIX domain-containing protein [Kiritimatiellia bacterium]|nr:NUDIX domain-containing protein [Kiritimatiellia bacterium]